MKSARDAAELAAVEQAQPDRWVEGNPWLVDFGELLAMFREAGGRSPSEAELRRLFAGMTETEVPR